MTYSVASVHSLVRSLEMKNRCCQKGAVTFRPHLPYTFTHQNNVELLGTLYMPPCYAHLLLGWNSFKCSLELVELQYGPLMLNIVNRYCAPTVLSIKLKCGNQLDRVVQSIYNISVVIDKGTSTHEPFKTSHKSTSRRFLQAFVTYCKVPQVIEFG